MKLQRDALQSIVQFIADDAVGVCDEGWRAGGHTGVGSGRVLVLVLAVDATAVTMVEAARFVVVWPADKDDETQPRVVPLSTAGGRLADGDDCQLGAVTSSSTLLRSVAPNEQLGGPTVSLGLEID
eukprot:gene9034-11595_t